MEIRPITEAFQWFSSVAPKSERLTQLFWSSVSSISQSSKTFKAVVVIAAFVIGYIAYRFFRHTPSSRTEMTNFEEIDGRQTHSIRMGMTNFEEIDGHPGANLCWLNSAVKFLAAIPGIEAVLASREGEVEWALLEVIKELRSKKEGVLDHHLHRTLLSAIETKRPDLLEEDDTLGVTIGNSRQFLTKLLGELYTSPIDQADAYCKLEGVSEVSSYELRQISGICFTAILTQNTRLLSDALLDRVEPEGKSDAKATLPLELPEVMAVHIDGEVPLEFTEAFQIEMPVFQVIEMPVFQEIGNRLAHYATDVYEPIAAISHGYNHYTAVIREGGSFVHHNDACLIPLSENEGKKMFAKSRYLLLKRVGRRKLDELNFV